MYEFQVFEVNNYPATLAPLGTRRLWMDDVPFKGIYRCFPMSLANQIGWGISFPKDISFRWNGQNNGHDGTHNANNRQEEYQDIEILSGHEYVFKNRGWATLAFDTGLKFVTDENTTMIGFPTPNEFIPGIHVLSVALSTSFFQGHWEVVVKLDRPNEIITIPAGTPIASVMPISLGQLNGSKAIFKNRTREAMNSFSDRLYDEIVIERTKEGKGSGFFRKATDHNGKPVGKHEVSSLKLINDKSEYDPRKNVQIIRNGEEYFVE